MKILLVNPYHNPSVSQFKAIYAENLRYTMKKRPELYAYDESQIPTVTNRMYDALVRGSASLDSLAIKATAKRFGVKPTYKEFIPFVKSLTVENPGRPGQSTLIQRSSSMLHRIHRARKIRRIALRHNPRFGSHRPVLFFGKKGWRRPKRSRLISHPIHVNPFRLHRRRHVRHNPLSLKGMVSKATLMPMLTIGGGLAGGFLAFPLVYGYLPASMKLQRKWLGLVNVVIGMLVYGLIKNKTAKTLGMVIGGTGIWDLIASNVPSLNALALPTAIPGLKIGTSVSGLGVDINTNTGRQMLGTNFQPAAMMGGTDAQRDLVKLMY